MTEQKNELNKITPEEEKVTKKLIKQSEDKINLLITEKEAKEKIVSLKNKFNKVKEGTDKPEFMFKQEFYDALLDIDNVNLKHYITQVNDAVDREESVIKSLKKKLEETEVLKNE